MDPTSSFFFHPFPLPFPHFPFVLLYCNRLRSFRETCDLFFSMSLGLVMIIRSQSPHLFPGLCYILFVYSAVFPFLLFTYYFLNLIYLYTNGRLFSIFNFIWKPTGRLSRTFLPFPISLWNDNCLFRYPSHFFVWCNTAFVFPILRIWHCVWNSDVSLISLFSIPDPISFEWIRIFRACALLSFSCLLSLLALAGNRFQILMKDK